MSKAFYMREKKAGRYVKCVRYQRAIPSDTGRARAAKRSHTRTAQRFINCRNSAEKLELLLYANFDAPNACFLTFTYDRDHLPRSKYAAKKYISKALGHIRAEKKRKKEAFPYVYTTEGSHKPMAGQENIEESIWELRPWEVPDMWDKLGDIPTEWKDGDARLHHHAVMLLSDTELDVVRSFWPFGQVYISRINIYDHFSFGRLSHYITKDSRSGKTRNGERAYIPSEGLTQPEITGRWVNEYEDIVPPKGAILISETRDDNLYSSYHHCSFIVPDAVPPIEYKSPYNSRKRKTK